MSFVKKRALFVSIPHSGTKIPKEAYWLQAIPKATLMCDVDAFVDELYLPILKHLHIPFVFFKWHRYAIDANRFKTDISPLTVERAGELLKTIYKNEKRDKGKPSDIHWLKTTKRQVLIKTAIPQTTHKLLIKKYIDPFHKQIQKQFKQIKQAGHKKVYMIDLHSMPSRGLAFHKDKGSLRTEVVVGNNWERSCSKEFTDLVIKAYRQAGFKVALNKPYKGGAITRSYGKPDKGQETLQVELNRKLYMDEKTKNKNRNYKKTQLRLNLAIQFIAKEINKI